MSIPMPNGKAAWRAPFVFSALMRSAPMRSALMRSTLTRSALVVVTGVAPQVQAAQTIYVSTTSTGLPSYTDEPTEPGSVLYLRLSDPPPRPRQTRTEARRRAQQAVSTGADVGTNTNSNKIVHVDAGTNARAIAIDPSIDRLATAAARTHGVPRALVLAVMHAESHFNPGARSAKGAIGLMQIMPPTAARYGVLTELDDRVSNIDVGTRYLRDLLKLFAGNEVLAVAAYNAGEGAVLRHGRRIPPYAETMAYVPKVMSLYASYSVVSGEGGPPRLQAASFSARN